MSRNDKATHVSPNVNLTGQIGFAQFLQNYQYPIVEYFPDERHVDGIVDRYSSDNFLFWSASFPVKFSVGVTPFKNLNIGFAKNIEIGYAFGWVYRTGFRLCYRNLSRAAVKCFFLITI
jgi:hypothetical protein